MKIKWPDLRFPPINLWSVWNRDRCIRDSYHTGYIKGYADGYKNGKGRTKVPKVSENYD